MERRELPALKGLKVSKVNRGHRVSKAQLEPREQQAHRVKPAPKALREIPEIPAPQARRELLAQRGRAWLPGVAPDKS
jgi:hypothetical protein